ncbi:MAG: hypothetical protein K0R54_4994 [Clostridiaceae bacterium]|jgi:hypothetical protein|nr:hypothetical protein [Clostridiaceae bacterium]
MNDIDMYISLINEIEANSILKALECNVRVNNLELMRTKIKTILRGGHSFKKVKGNPFMNILVRHKKKQWDSLNEKEFFVVLNKDSNNIPDYVKFANLLLKYPDKKNEYIELINKNKNENKYIFDFDLKFDNKGEIKEYCSKLLNSKESTMDKLKDYVIKASERDLLNTDIGILKDIKNWDIIKLYNNLKTDNEQLNMFMKFEYLREHDDIDIEIFNKFSHDIIIYLLYLFDESCADISKIEVNKLKVELIERQNYNKKLEKENLEKEKEIKKLIKELKNDTSLVKLEAEEFEKLKLELEEMKSQIYKYSNDNKNLIKQKEDLKNKNGMLNNELKSNKKELESYINQIKNTELYYECSFPQNYSEKIFGVIYNMDINIAKVIFNEVEFINIDEWKNNIDNVRKIYVQIEGISTRELNKIKNYCSKNGIEFKQSISICDEKNLIEVVSMIKNNHVGGLK